MRSRTLTCTSRIAGWAAVAALAIAAFPLATMAQSTPSEALATQTSIDRGVTVKVTPKAIAPTAGRWEFTVVLDTHSTDLSDDLLQSSLLVADDGRSFRPVAWTGAGPGGHHREGVLAFDAPAPRPTSIEIRIVRPGESAPRTFRWQL